MAAYEPPKPIIVHPEVPWGECVDTVWGAYWGRPRKGPNASDYEEVRVWPAWLSDAPRFAWWTPGWSMTIATDHDMNRARALAMAIGDKARLEILEAAWSLCRSDK